jgi:hypothetical protein
MRFLAGGTWRRHVRQTCPPAELTEAAQPIMRSITTPVRRPWAKGTPASHETVKAGPTTGCIEPFDFGRAAWYQLGRRHAAPHPLEAPEATTEAAGVLMRMEA